jgi:hypothetical protein
VGRDLARIPNYTAKAMETTAMPTAPEETNKTVDLPPRQIAKIAVLQAIAAPIAPVAESNPP